jgi:hypothetical protein
MYNENSILFQGKSNMQSFSKKKCFIIEKYLKDKIAGKKIGVKNLRHAVLGSLDKSKI